MSISRPQPNNSIEDTVVISVIVPTLNESRIIRQCLTALQLQSMPADQFEILVVDNGSHDNTVEIARNFTERVYSFPGVTVGHLRNNGAKLARGSMLAFIDADCIASRSWLEGAMAAFSDGGVAVGNKYDRPTDAGWIEGLWLGDVAPGRSQTQELWSGNLIVGRETFLACGGFDEVLVSYEDIDLSHALLKRGCLYLDDRVRVVHSGGPKTLAEFARQQLWHGFEEWTVFRRGIKRDTFVPTMVCIVAYGLMILALVLPTPTNWGALALGVVLVLSAAIWRLMLQLRSYREPRWRTVMQLGILNVICLSSKALAVVIRFCNRQWAGRRKTVIVSSD